jgi:hypothetical protein
VVIFTGKTFDTAHAVRVTRDFFEMSELAERQF